jgi:DNA-binding CsgD family transcriptional regulator
MAIGRAREEAAVAAVVDAALAGRGGALAIRGDPGIGKSTLLAFARGRAERAAVVETSGVETEAELAFVGLADVLRTANANLDTLTERQSAVLQAALGVGDPVAVDPLTIGGATLALLAASAADLPLVVLVDDAQWLDAESQAALAFAARRVGADAVAILFAARTDPSFMVRGVPELQLEGLEREDALELLGGRIPSPQVAEQLVVLTGGNPLALLELPSVATPEQLAGAVPLEDPLRFGPAIEEAFARRAFRLGEDTRFALVVAASEGTGDDALVAIALERLGLTPDVLERAEDDALVARNRGKIVFRHPLVRSAVYHSAAPSERRQAHAALASAYAKVDPDRHAWHLAAAATGVDIDAGKALAASAERARARGANHVAAVGFERAAQLSTAGTTRARLLAAAGDAALAAGQHSAAQRLVDEGLGGENLDPVARASLLGVAGRTALHAGDQEDAFVAFLEAAELVETLEPERASALLADAVRAAMQLGGDALALAAARLEALAPPDDPWIALLVAQARGTATSFAGTPGSRAAIHEAVTFGEAIELRSAEQLCTAGRSYLMLGRNRDAATLARKAHEAARREGPSKVLVDVLRLQASAQVDCGRRRDAYAAAGEAVELAGELGLPVDACACLAILAEIDAGTGNESACRDHVARAVDLAETFHLDFNRVRAERFLGQLLLVTGRLEQAAAELERVLHATQASDNNEISISPVFDLVETYVRLGREQEARDALAWAVAAMPPESPVEESLFDRCAGLVEEEFEPLFERALAAHELDEFRDEFPFEVARINLSFGERLRRTGRRKDARTQLERALALFEEIGARAWGARATEELQASGTRRRPPEVSRETLTPRELQIALAVAEGRSNRDVAAQLFLTPKTVEYHLTRVYRKLSVRTRAELVRLLSRDSFRL